MPQGSVTCLMRGLFFGQYWKDDPSVLFSVKCSGHDLVGRIVAQT